MSEKNPYESPQSESQPPAELAAAGRYLTAPSAEETGFPKGIPYIIGNETAERFSFYGMKTILLVFMTEHLLNFSSGGADYMSKGYATIIFHLFVAAVYFTPLIGSIISDAFWGKYKTIMILSVVYCLGHLALALDESRIGLFVGLSLIAIGAGGIKPCVSAHVGDQFGKGNKRLLSQMFSWFYFSINTGAFVASLLTPILLERYGPSIAFGVPGVLMLMATFLFWLGRHRFIHVPASGWKKVKEAFRGEGLRAVFNLSKIYIFVAVFWSLFDQTGSTWISQGKQMDSNVYSQWLSNIIGDKILPSQIQAMNPLLILILIPVFSYLVYPIINRFFTLTPLRKISIGFFLTVLAFACSSIIQGFIDRGDSIHITWQYLPYLILTCAEVMVSITCLEYSYTQAPKAMKSFIMSLFLLSVAVGNLFTSLITAVTQIESIKGYFMYQMLYEEKGKEKLTDFFYADFYWLFTGIMFVAAVIFIFVARTYKGKTYTDDI